MATKTDDIQSPGVTPEPSSTDAARAVNEMANKRAEKQEEIVKESEGRKLAAGTVLLFGGEKVTLKNDTIVTYDQDQSEQKFAGLCHVAGQECMDANRKFLKFRYDGFGARQPITDQVDDAADLPVFIKALTHEEAISFGVESDWVALNPKKAEKDEK